MIILRFYLTVDDKGIKLHSSEKHKKLNQIEQVLAVNLVQLTKAYLEQASKQLEAEANAKKVTSEILGANGQSIAASEQPRWRGFGPADDVDGAVEQPVKLEGGRNGTAGNSDNSIQFPQ